MDYLPSPFKDEEVEKKINLKFCTDLKELETDIDSLEKILDPVKRYEKIRRLEEQINEEMVYLVDAKHYAESLLKKLIPKKQTCKDYLGIKED